MEFKDFHAVNYKAKGDSDRTRTGLAAVLGNIDAVDDITHPGSFLKTIQEGARRSRHLWNHDSTLPPIAKTLELREIGRSELPAEVLAKAPEATGGLLVKRTYLTDPFSDWVLKAIDAGEVNEMSFAYNIIKSDFTEFDGKTIRNLREVALMDTSDVNWGANPATIANGQFKSMIRMRPLGELIQQLRWHEEKAGRRNNGADQILINTLHDISMSLGCDSCSPEATGEKAEAVLIDTSLRTQRLERMRLQNQLLEVT